MAREYFIKDAEGKSKWVGEEEYGIYLANKYRADTAFNVISDTMDVTLNPADGKRYDSKSRYYAAVKSMGCEIIGGESFKEQPRRPINMPRAGYDVKAAIEQLRSR
jgi:hypothetical protein